VIGTIDIRIDYRYTVVDSDDGIIDYFHHYSSSRRIFTEDTNESKTIGIGSWPFALQTHSALNNKVYLFNLP